MIALSITVITNLLVSQVAGLFGLPTIATCLVTNLVIKPCLLKEVSFSFLGVNFSRVNFSPSSFKLGNNRGGMALRLLNGITLNFVTFTVNGRFEIDSLGTVNGRTAIVNVLRTLTTALLISVDLILLSLTVPGVLDPTDTVVLNTVTSTATPTTALVIMERCGTGNGLASLLLPVITLSSTMNLIVFSISCNVTQTVRDNGTGIVSVIMGPFVRIVLSLLLNTFVN